MGETDRPLILPPLRRTAKDAEAFARVVHEGQFDKAGRPYIEHVGRVVGRVMLYGGTDEAVQIAWLHDVIEDTPYTAAHLHAEGFSASVVSSVETLTKWPGNRGSYLAQIGQVTLSEHLPTILVKIADVEDNSAPERLALLAEPTRERLTAKYCAALPILKDAAARLGWRKG